MVRRTADATVRFGPYAFDRTAGQLTKHGIRVKLHGQPVRLLEALLERPGQTVAREDIQRRLWPADTFVDFENGLNTAVKRLRTALNDSAETPVYVETVARAGYRFIAPVSVPDPVAPAAPPQPTRRDWLRPALFGGAGVVAGGAGSAWVLGRGERKAPVFLPVTFQRGAIYGARFAPDGQSILFAAQFGPGPRRLYLNNGVSPESRALGLDDYALLGVSSRGELALTRVGGTMPIRGGTLERVMMNGGSPRVVEHDVTSAAWSPDGQTLAIVRAGGGASQLEYPPGKVLYRSAGWLSSVRMSPAGEWIAFAEHPVRHDDAGVVRIVSAADGRPRAASRSWANVGGLAWRGPRELWLTATTGAAANSLWSLPLDGPAASVLAAPGALTLSDVSPTTGRALVQRESRRLEMAGSLRGGPQRDLSWHDWSRVVDLSPDGQRVLFEESGQAVAQQAVTYLFDAASTATTRVAEGVGQALSPDGRHVLLLRAGDRRKLLQVPVGGGPPREFTAPGGLEIQWARFYPDGQSLLALANQSGQPLRLYRFALHASSPAVALTPPGMVRHAAISRDGRRLAVLGADGQLAVYPALEPGPARRVAVNEPLGPILWMPDHRQLYVQHLSAYTEVPSRVSLVDVDNGRLAPWRSVGPADAMGVNSVTRVIISASQQSWVISYRRLLSELYQATL